MTYRLRIVPLLLLLGACYKPVIADHAQRCDDKSLCAEGYTCALDDYCYKTAEVPNFDLSMPDMAERCTILTCRQTDKPQCDPVSGQCVVCLTDADCPEGDMCHANECTPGCSASRGCGAGTCNVDMGLCVTCKKDADCANGRCNVTTMACVPCLPTDDNCAKGTYCVQTGLESYACEAGCKDDTDCVHTPDGGFGDAGVPPNTFVCCSHVCRTLTTDVNNCGICGHACGKSGKTNTPLTCCTGTCIDTTTDINNCGACGSVCSIANGTPVCSTSQCTISTSFATCDPEHADCNGDPTDGCEQNIVNDVNNCLGCGNGQASSNFVCSAPNATVGCNYGCTITACATNFGDCDGAYNNGCETNVTADPKNCGACGMTCPIPPNGTPACAASTCGLATCLSGFLDCDKNPANGCEVNVQGSDPNNCGACNTTCNGTCVKGSCILCNGVGTVLGTFGGVTFCKIPAIGTMTDTNVLDACLAAGLYAPCAGTAPCSFNDAFCKPISFETCPTSTGTAGASIMANLSVDLCGAGTLPNSCSKLFDTFQYMGNNIAFGQQACGAVMGQPFCAAGASYANKFSLCVQ